MEHLSVMTAPPAEAPTAALGAGPGFVVELEAFSGPLDLLLHLLREEQLEISDIPIARIADQFLQAIHELGLNQAADYLDMASRLVRLKAQMLLPRRPEEDVDLPEHPRIPPAGMVRHQQKRGIRKAVRQASELEEILPGVAYTAAFGNIAAFQTGSQLVLVDTGNQVMAQTNYERIRAWTSKPLTTVVYTHGHIDHVFGLAPFEAEADEAGRPRPHVVGHRNVPARFERYVLTAGYNGVINARQFGFADFRWPTEYRYPDETYETSHVLEVEGERFELYHDKGETDDATWVWMPGRRVLCPGDLFIWASPNCGNPQKVQRYPREWAAGLRKMAAKEPEVLLPGHGWPIVGADRVHQALSDTATLLESLVEQTLEMMNAGARLDEILHTIKVPEGLLDKPYLRPVYDEPEFIVRTIWRLYGGWYDGNPAHLKPAPDAALAAELASLAGGPGRLAARASEMAGAGELRLAGHLAEMAAQAAPGDPGIQKVRSDVFGQRAEVELSTMSKGVFSWAANEWTAGSPD
jgi:glyoxylase-like metal-dependent hydrolase (beta-lactamase superfamily II)